MANLAQTTPKNRFDPGDRQAVKRRFHAINRERLKRVRAIMREHTQDFLELLPLMFHINHPMLPGYLNNRTPCGVSNYTPTDASIEAGKRVARSFDYRRRAQQQYDIQAIYLMGSSGTIGHSSTSDFDVWICHRPDLDDAGRTSLRHKADGISSWAESLGLEVHFFILDADSFRAGKHDELSAESSGSSLHDLLVEEFYRTGILVAGRYPLWWMIPPEHEHEYRSYADHLLDRRFINTSECIDFGGLENLSAGEFFGAALWQLYKAVDSPYKSVLKILLAETYADDFPEIELLSLRFKKAVYGDETRLDRLDPYVMMCDKVEEYLTRVGDHPRLELARRCLYFKVNEKMSRTDTLHNISWRREAMRDLVEQWGWSRSQLYNLDARSSWKIDRVMEERRALVNALTQSYQTLSRLARRHANQLSIDPGELHKLGRKLHTAFERKAGKIEIINPGISTDLTEHSLSLLRHTDANLAENWSLYRDALPDNPDARPAPLKQSDNLLELLAWCHFNRVIHPVVTKLHLYPREDGMEQWELRAVVDNLQQLFPRGELPPADIDSLAKAARIIAGGLFINLGIDPMIKLTRQGKQLITDRNDALCYGGLGENLIQTVDAIVITSWQEILTFSYRGPHALFDCLSDLLAWTPAGKNEKPVDLPCFCFSSTRGHAIAQRAQGLYADLINQYYRGDGNGRRVVHSGRAYEVFELENQVPRAVPLDSRAALIRHLGAAQPVYSPVFFDPQTLNETALPEMYAQHRRGEVHLYFRVETETADVWVIDERGSLWHRQSAFRDKLALLSRYHRFLGAITHRRDCDEQRSTPIQYYQVFSTGHDKHRFAPQEIDTMELAEGFLGIQVIGDIGDAGRTLFSFYCGDREFTTLQYGDSLFEAVAEFVLTQRSSGAAYPIYITDIDLSRELLGADGVGQLQTIHLLNYKQRIESALNKQLELRATD